MGKGMNTAGKIVAWVLAVLLIVGVAGVIVYFVAKEEGADYFVEYNGEKYLGNAEGGKLDITAGKEYRFEVRSLTGENVNFDVKVTSNPANNFEYTVDGKLCVWNGSDEKANDYTEIFNVPPHRRSSASTTSCRRSIRGRRWIPVRWTRRIIFF